VDGLGDDDVASRGSRVSKNSRRDEPVMHEVTRATTAAAGADT
jgi:hypothetical protein